MDKTKSRCGNCIHYYAFADSTNRGICNKTEMWYAVYFMNKACKDFKCDK